MNLRKSLLLLLALSIFQFSFSQTNFIIQETSVKKNLTQCINLAKKSANVLLKKQTVYTIPISSKSTLTAVAITKLSEKFTVVFPKSNTGKGDERVIERGFSDERNQIVKLMYGFIAKDQRQTTDFAQIVVFFDNSGTSPEIKDIQVKNKVDLGIITLTEREYQKLIAPEPKPAAKPTTKPTTKPATKPATKKPAAKKKS
ncbi:MAG TPA: hypothetical protein VGQ59_13720 [Cyclobacteriaceae bacterium]|jgi:hypothetical protein|nr:hypothetical protein [Cyclobacteriaceae bacterium]